MQGTQNKLFAIFMGVMITLPTASQLQVPFLQMRNVYEIRERPGRIYHWSALVSAQYLSELPWNILASSLFFFCWYWTVGFPSDRAGYTYLMWAIVNPFYYTGLGQATAAMAPDAEIAALLFAFLLGFGLIL
jgi:ATP-binding cassette, subfamily G (WHITE), member 2, SNQ2